MKAICWMAVVCALSFTGCAQKNQDGQVDSKIGSLDYFKSSSEKGDGQVDFLESYRGTYLPETYINALEKTKSHIKAWEDFHLADKEKPDALFLGDNMLECVLNFHEGYGLQILDKGEDSLTVKTFVGNETCKLEGGQYLTMGGTRYKKVDGAQSIDGKVVSNFIAKTLLSNSLGEKKLTDGEHTLQMRDGKIFYDGGEYEYGTDFVLDSHRYDHIISTGSQQTKYIEISEGGVNIYSARSSDGNYEDGWEASAVFDLEASFGF